MIATKSKTKPQNDEDLDRSHHALLSSSQSDIGLPDSIFHVKL